MRFGPSWELPEADWQTMIDINLSGVWHATKAAVPHIIDRGPGGSVILISSTAGLRGIPNIAHYNAAKHGVLGLARTLANELSPHRIRVNSVHPTNVRTEMIDNASSAQIYRPDLENPTFEDSLPALANINMWDVPYLDVAGRRQRRAVPRLRGVPLHHGDRAAGRSRNEHEVLGPERSLRANDGAGGARANRWR